MEEAVVAMACDQCHRHFPMQNIQWAANYTQGLCQDCYAKAFPEEEAVKEERISIIPVPVYFFYDYASRLLHISTDLESPKLWVEHQGSNWWFYQVSTIIVKFFDGANQAYDARDALITKLAPRYGNYPGDLDGVDKTDPIVFDLKITEDTDAPKEKIVGVRVSEDIAKAIDQLAINLNTPKADWVRSVIYQALRDQFDSLSSD